MDSVPPAGGGGGLGAGGGPGPGYPESTDSSPRSRGGDSWDEPFPSSAAAAAAGGGGRLRLMCSFGGRIVPRPTDKSLCYLGGETRIVAVDRNASLADVHARLSRSLLSGQPFTLKYQLPNEDLDSLISVSTDEDLDNLVDEYDRVAAASSAGGSTSRTSRIRLFLFPAKPESSSSLGSLLDDTSKSETWFVDALNNAISGSFDGIPRGISTDSASVNCLLGLEDDSSQHSRSGVPSSGPSPADHQLANQQKHAAAAAAAAGRHQHDVQSVPDSPMLDKNSSFGSTSSAPSLSNLPPIRVRQQEVMQPDSRVAPPTLSVEDHFAQMGISSDQPPHMVGYLQQPLQQAPIPAMGMPVATMPPPEVPSRVFSDDERSDHGGGVRMTQPPKQEVPPTADPRTMYYNDMSPRNETDAASYRAPAPASDAAAAAQPPPGYVYAQMQAQQQLHQQAQQQLHQQPQQQLHQQPQQQPPQQLQQQPPQQQIQQQPQQQLQQQAQQQLQQQPPQQQLQQQAQQQLQQQPPPQQQHQPGPQQIVMAGNQHFIHNPATGTFIPIQSYYHQPVPQAAPQQQQASAFDPNTGMYYIPMRPNAPQQYSMPPGAGAPMPAPTLVESAPKPTVPIPQQYMKPELQQQQPGLYRTAAPAAPLPGSNAAPGYAGMGYHHVIQPHHHPAQQPAATMAGNYGYEYPADPRAQQVFYSQAGAPPASLAPQYQPAMGSPDASQADLNQNRGS